MQNDVGDGVGELGRVNGSDRRKRGSLDAFVCVVECVDNGFARLMLAAPGKQLGRSCAHGRVRMAHQSNEAGDDGGGDAFDGGS
jgi:hypothetical protein